MKLICHRGNIYGPNKKEENMPDYLIRAMEMGYDVETDVRFINGKLYLGHDEPQYEIDINFLQNPKIWCHCKNLNALYELSKYNDIHYFWHGNDDYVLTSQRWIWTLPGKELTDRSVCVMPEWNDFFIDDCCYAVCSDYVDKIDKKPKEK